MLYYLIVSCSSAIFVFSIITFLKEPFFKIAISATSQLNIILDNSLEERDKDEKLLKNLPKLIGNLLLGLSLLFLIAIVIGALPFLYWEHFGEMQADISSIYFYISLIVGSSPFFFYKRKEDYSYWSKLLHTVLLDNYAIGKYLFARELKKKYKQKISVTDQDFVMVTGLARSGTTALTNLIFDKIHFHSIEYSNVPFLLSPNLWKKISKHQKVKLRERAHGDKMLFSESSIEALEEYFFKVHLNDRYIKDDYLEKHEIPASIASKYYQYQNLFQENQQTTYLAKNNNFILRYENLRKLNKQFYVILIFRNPLDQAQSLLDQHKNFSDQQHKDDFVLKYMNWLGHHEFGLNYKQFKLFEKNSLDLEAFKDQLSFWLQAWINYYSYVVKICNADQKLFLIDYEDLALNPNELKKVIGMKIGKELEAEYIKPFGLKKALSGALFDSNDETLKEANYIYEELLSLKTKVKF